MKKINEEDELLRLVDQVTQGRVVGFRVTWSPTEYSVESNFLSGQQPREECRCMAALALRAMLEDARSERITSFVVFWDGGEAVNLESTVVLPFPVKMLKLTLHL